MLLKKMNECPEITANDGCRLREVLHPARDPVDLPYSLAHAVVHPGKRTRRHFLRQNEVYVILSGHGRLHIGDELQVVEAGDAIRIPPDREQWIECVGETELKFLAIVSPPWIEEDDIALE